MCLFFMKGIEYEVYKEEEKDIKKFLLNLTSCFVASISTAVGAPNTPELVKYSINYYLGRIK